MTPFHSLGLIGRTFGTFFRAVAASNRAPPFHGAEIAAHGACFPVFRRYESGATGASRQKKTAHRPRARYTEFSGHHPSLMGCRAGLLACRSIQRHAFPPGCWPGSGFLRRQSLLTAPVQRYGITPYSLFTLRKTKGTTATLRTLNTTPNELQRAFPSKPALFTKPWCPPFHPDGPLAKNIP